MLETNGRCGAPRVSEVGDIGKGVHGMGPKSIFTKSSDFAHYRVVLVETKPGRDGPIIL